MPLLPITVKRTMLYDGNKLNRKSTDPWVRCVRVFLPPSYILPPRRAENAHLAHPPPPAPPAQASGAARGCLVSWIGASESLVDASGTIFSRLQRSLVPMLWFGSQLSGVLGRSKLDLSMCQGSVAWRSHSNWIHATSPPLLMFLRKFKWLRHATDHFKH